MKEFDFFVYCDGSYKHGQAVGGLAYVIVDEHNKEVYRYSEQAQNTTSNRMEYTAFIKSTQWLQQNIKELRNKKILFQSDSELLVKTFTLWIDGWHKKGWKTSKKTEPANLDLVKEIFTIKNENPNFELKWIKGHAGHKWNELVDLLAQGKDEVESDLSEYEFRKETDKNGEVKIEVWNIKSDKKELSLSESQYNLISKSLGKLSDLFKPPK